MIRKQSADIKLFEDKTPSDSLPVELAQELSDKGLIAEDGSRRVSFCGMILINNTANIFLPRSSGLSELSCEDSIPLAASVMKAVNKYGIDKKTKVTAQDLEDGNRGLGQLSLIKELLDDFCQNGIYSKRNKITSLNNGRPDWKRTVGNVVPFPGKNGVPVYIDTYCNRRKYFTDCEISAIHAKVIKELDEKFGWLITGNDRLIAPELSEFNSPFGDEQYYVSVLQKELQVTYSERDMRLLRNLVEYIKNISGKQQSSFIAGVRDFHYAWEHMLSRVLEHTANLNHKLPAPAYMTREGDVLTANEKSMRTDIILEDKQNKKWAIVDAKYYAANSVANAPGWPDLVKQFFYEKALKLVNSDFDISNFFIFPGSEGNLDLVRMKDRKEEIFYDKEFPPVKCLYVSPLVVINNYISNTKVNWLSDVILNREAPKSFYQKTCSGSAFI